MTLPTATEKQFKNLIIYTAHTHPFNSPLSGTTLVSRYKKGTTIWILLKQETVSGSCISWAICKSVLCSSQMPFLSPNQQCQSTEGIYTAIIKNSLNIIYLAASVAKQTRCQYR